MKEAIGFGSRDLQMNSANKPMTKKGGTRNALQDVSNHFNEDCSKDQQVKKRVKTSLRGTIGITSSDKSYAAFSAEKSVDRVHNATSSNSKVRQTRNVIVDASVHAGSNLLEGTMPGSIALTLAASDYDVPKDIINNIDSKERVLDMADVHTSLPLINSQLSRTVTTAAPITARQVGLVRDIDDSTDPLLVTSYVRQMYAYYRTEEHRAVVGPYMQYQSEINVAMRAILIDWLCEVHYKWKLHPETLYLTVNIVDRYIAKKKVSKQTLQLVGSCALLIASKYEEIYPTPVGDLVYVCDGAFDPKDLLLMEVEILKTLNYQISIPTIYKFLVRYLNAANPSKILCYMSSYVAEASLLNYEMINECKPSLLAAAAVLIGRKAIGRNSWNSSLVKFSGYCESEIVPVARRMIAAMMTTLSSSTKLVALKHKYGRRSKSYVSDIALPIEF